MADVDTLFWDVGGVLLTNAWDRSTRRRAARHFQFDEEDFEERHEHVVSAFETAKLSLDGYLDQTVFCHPRPYTREEFKAFMFAQSRPHPEILALARGLSSRYLMAAINNESLELNQYRIREFGLRDIFTVFFSSCFVRLRKPDPAIYRLALEMTQKDRSQCCFIDDRPLNVEGARRAGIEAIHFRDARQLRQELRRLGVEVRAGHSVA